MTAIAFRAIKTPANIFDKSAKSILDKVDARVSDFASGELTDDFNETQKTFKDKFAVQTQDKSSRSQVNHEAFIAEPIYFFLSGGTAVRYATMSPDWRSKTQPGRLGAGPGRGRVLYVNKRKPRPGIKARKFDEQIVQKEKKPFERAVEEAIAAGVKVVF